MNEREYPSYLKLYRTGELERRIKAALSLLERCTFCPHECKAERFADSEKGVCRTGRYARVASYTPHFGEEPGISGKSGSGTIFFVHCNLRCRFCQNYQISQPKAGEDRGEFTTPERLAEMMLELQDAGCHNINLVSPSHIVPQFLEALKLAIEQGLHIPIVYNTNAYDKVETLRLLDGIVDIYLPDFKYFDNAKAKRLSGAPKYVEVATAALKEMYRQVGAPVFDSRGVLLRGLVIRHLVLPNGLSDSPKVLRWIAKNLGTEVYISLMSQYYPTHKAVGDPELGRRISFEEYEEALDTAEEVGLENGWFQQMSAAFYYRPDFRDPKKPFKDIDDFL